jgi:hypothetical protein
MRVIAPGEFEPFENSELSEWRRHLLSCFVLLCTLVPTLHAGARVLPLRISDNHRFLETSDGAPFFWLGDTGWLLFEKLDRADTLKYLDDPHRKGFNVIQVMVIPSVDAKNAYGAPALTTGAEAHPAVTPGNSIDVPGEYDYWDHIDWVLDQAADRGMYLGMVACWGSVVDKGVINQKNAAAYARFLAERFKNKANVIWILGGDTRGDKNTEVWRTMGRILKQFDPQHLITYHPFGRTQSSQWFHNDAWLDFNMFQSGHRRYDQDNSPGAKGEDNWRYVREDYARRSIKPVLDGEPSYENIPQGLHDPNQPYWTANDVRRYAWWSVFAGAFGHTYGENSVMQMHKSGEKGAYGVRTTWQEGLNAPGSSQMQYVKKLMLSRPFFERVPDESLIAGDNGTRHDYVIATRGKSYAFVYTWSGKPFRVQMQKISGDKVRAWWYDPRTGNAQQTGAFDNKGTRDFHPPGKPAPGNDWVLVLDDLSKQFGTPGR